MTTVQSGVGATPSRAYISFSAEINPNTTESLIASAAQIANQNVPELYLMLSTPGGSVMNGMNIYNALRAMPFKLITHNVGNVDSIGNVIFLAGDERFASPHSTFMFHGVAFTGNGPYNLDERTLRERLGSVQADQKRMASIIEERTTLTDPDIQPLFLEAQTKDATYAVSAGIVHEIKHAEVAPGCPVITLVFNR